MTLDEKRVKARTMLSEFSNQHLNLRNIGGVMLWADLSRKIRKGPESEVDYLLEHFEHHDQILVMKKLQENL